MAHAGISVKCAPSVLRSLKPRFDNLALAPVSLPVSSLEWREVVKIFELSDGTKEPKWSWDVEDQKLYDPPVILNSMLDELDVLSAPSSDNEAFARCRLNLILLSCLAVERKHTSEEQAVSSSSISSDTQRPSTPSSLPVELKLETPLSCTIQYKGEQRALTGLVDYSIWYDDSLESMAANLVCVEAKKKDYAGTGRAQCLGYMAIIHSLRKIHEKRNAVIYGVCTDGDEFMFLRIDNESRVERSLAYTWTFGEHYQKLIISTIRYIMRAAINSSPTTSPVKLGALETRLRSFSFNNKFDYGIRHIDEDAMVYNEEDLLDRS